MKQLVSILIPAFNAEKWIGGCIASALAQEWPRKEIIVVDDGSNDSTLEIAKSYTSPIVHVTTQKNLGAGAARNHALSVAQGDYIQWLDADDLLAPDKIALQLAGAEPGQTSRVLLSGSWGKFHHQPERAKFIPNLLWESLMPLEWMYRKVEYGLWMAIESWLVSRRLTEIAGPWNESLRLGIDGEYFNRILSFSENVRFIPDARCICRRGNFGISSSMTLNNNKLDSLAFVVFSSTKTLLSMENSKRTRNAALKHLNRYSIYFFPDRPDIIEKNAVNGQRCRRST